MSKWSTFTAYASLIVASVFFVWSILTLLAGNNLAAGASALIGMLGAYMLDAWSVYFRDKEAAENAAPTVVVNAPSNEPVTVS